MKSMKEIAEDGFMHDFDWNVSLFDSWLAQNIAPNKLEKGYEEMAPAYKKWLTDNDLMKHLAG
jgi:hypothetical protein